jgi:Protein of unknown function (DUF3800)
MSIHYDLYVDETFPRGRVALAFGAVRCSSERAVRILADLAGLRAEAKHSSEIKWEKTSGSTLPFYRQVLDLFFEHRYPRLTVLQIEKGLNWHRWGRNEEERFFKSLYFFLMRCTHPAYRYSVYLDDRDLQRSYRRTTLHYLINRKRREDWSIRVRNIRLLKAVDSRAVEMVQLADLLLGCATSNSKARAKLALRQHFEENLTRSDGRVRIDTWTPQPPNQAPAPHG